LTNENGRAIRSPPTIERNPHKLPGAEIECRAGDRAAE
jgi:hypothetical protein